MPPSPSSAFIPLSFERYPVEKMQKRAREFAQLLCKRRAVERKSAPSTSPSAPTPKKPSSAPPEGLSPEEHRMIQQYFPESPGMKLRLYGPGRTDKVVNPHALGNRIDLRG